ncbi:MAG: GDYXXLXY domain-containing protein, partial [Alphaproteobacteria bacterium]|nr:GDYXXLXY domain-containing protein [Alphaproteobacteria bacterium]
MATTLRILIVVGLQTALLAYMILDRQAVLSASRTVTLKVAPVDPRDIFRGDYVILTYEISRLDPTKIEGDNTFGYGDKVLVTLVPNGDTWTATG